MKLNVSHERIVFISVQSQTIWEKIFFFIFHLESVFFSTSDLMGNLIPWESRTIKMVEGLQSSPLGDMKWKVTGSSVEQVIKKTWNRLKYVGLTPGG